VNLTKATEFSLVFRQAPWCEMFSGRYARDLFYVVYELLELQREQGQRGRYMYSDDLRAGRQGGSEFGFR
jgi:hypothetical protein